MALGHILLPFLSEYGELGGCQGRKSEVIFSQRNSVLNRKLAPKFQEAQVCLCGQWTTAFKMSRFRKSRTCVPYYLISLP